MELLWSVIPPIGIVLWGALCVTDNLWYDEAYSAALVALPFTKMLYITAVDAHSPFYYTMLKVVYALSGGGTHFFVLKIFSLAFMSGYLFLGKYYVRKLFDREISVWFMIFSILFPIMSVQAGNVRMYAVALFFMTLMGLSSFDFYKKPTLTKWIVFCLASICTVYCHTFAMIQAFWFYILFFVVLLLGKKKELIKGYLICGVAVSVAFSPWLFVTARQMMLRMRYDTGSMQEKASLNSIFMYATEWFSALETPIFSVIIMEGLLCLVLLVLGFLYIKKQKEYLPLMGIGALFLTIMTGFLISVFVNNCFLGRYAFPGFGFLMLMLALGMKEIGSLFINRETTSDEEGRTKESVSKETCRKRITFFGSALICMVALIAFLMQYASEVQLEFDQGRNSFDAFMAEVKEEDMVLCSFAHTGFLSVYYPDREFYIDGYKPYKMPFENVIQLDSHSELSKVKGSIWYMHFLDSTPTEFEGYTLVKTGEFHYMYYDFVIYRLFPA